MDCKTARRKIDSYFVDPAPSKETEEALRDVLYNHLTMGTTVEKHNVSCQTCWDYYEEMKQRYCGG